MKFFAMLNCTLILAGLSLATDLRAEPTPENAITLDQITPCEEGSEIDGCASEPDE